jgi:hypothetical protein
MRKSIFLEECGRIVPSQKEVTVLFLERALFFLHGEGKRHPRPA